MNRKSRSGFTLIEAMCYISVASLLFMLAIQILHVSFQLSNDSQRELEQASRCSQLVRQLRYDLALGGSFQPISESQFQFTHQSGRTIVWTLRSPQLMQRNAEEPGQSAVVDLADKHTRQIDQQNFFRLSEDCSAVLDLSSDSRQANLLLKYRNRIDGVTRVLRRVNLQDDLHQGDDDDT